MLSVPCPTSCRPPELQSFFLRPAACSETLLILYECCAVLCCAVLCCAVLCCAVLCCVVLCCTVLCGAVLLCCAGLCWVVLGCVVLCTLLLLYYCCTTAVTTDCTVGGRNDVQQWGNFVINSYGVNY